MQCTDRADSRAERNGLGMRTANVVKRNETEINSIAVKPRLHFRVVFIGFSGEMTGLIFLRITMVVTNVQEL